MVYYLDGGVVGLGRLDLSIGVWFWINTLRLLMVFNQTLSIHDKLDRSAVGPAIMSAILFLT